MRLKGIEWNDDRQCYTVAETETHYVDVLKMLFNHRVVLTPKSCLLVYDKGWCYANLLAAVAAVRAWDPETSPEPLGYIKRVGEDPEHYKYPPGDLETQRATA